MNVRTLPIVAVSCLLSPMALAGAWGPGSFENDDALDWVWELEASTGPSVITAALKSATDAQSYIEVSSGSYAVAAAEVLAALIGKPSEGLPPEVVAWTENQSFKPSSELLGKARLALSNIMVEERSELAQLWAESDVYQEWRSQLAALAKRLE